MDLDSHLGCLLGLPTDEILELQFVKLVVFAAGPTTDEIILELQIARFVVFAGPRNFSRGRPRGGVAITFQADSTETLWCAAVLEEITDAVEMDPILVASDAEVLTGAESMYNPFDRPSDEEVVEAIPRDRSRSRSRSRSA